MRSNVQATNTTQRVNRRRRESKRVKPIFDIRLSIGQEYRLKDFLRYGESFVRGDKMFKRAKRLKGLADRKDALLLVNRQEEIPGRMRAYVLVFADIVRDNPEGRPSVLCLCHGILGSSEWCLRYEPLDDVFGLVFRIVQKSKR